MAERFEYTYDMPDGSQYTIIDDNEASAKRQAMEQYRADIHADYAKLPVGRKINTAVGDLMRSTADYASLGLADRLAALTGGMPYERQRALTEKSHERAGTADIMAALGGYGALGKLVPSAVIPATEAFGGGRIARAVVGTGVAGAETGALTAAESAVKGQNPVTGFMEGAKWGGGTHGALGVLSGLARGVRGGVGALDRLTGGALTKEAQNLGEAAKTAKYAFRNKPPEAGVGAAAPKSAAFRFGEAVAPVFSTVPPRRTPPAKAAEQAAADTSLETAGAAAPTPPAGPLAAPSVPPVAQAMPPVPPVVAPVLPVAAAVPKGPLAAPAQSEELTAARKAQFKAQESLAAAKKQLAGIKDPGGRANMRTKIKMLTTAHEKAQAKVAGLSAVSPKVAEDTALETAGAATPPVAPASLPAGPLVAETAAPVASASDIEKAQARYDKADADLKVAMDKFKAEPNKLANRMRLENASKEAEQAHRANMAAKGIIPGKATTKPLAPEDVVPRKAAAGVLSAEKNLPEPNQLGINTKTGKPISTKATIMEGKAEAKSSKQERAKEREKKRGPTPEEERATAIGRIHKAFEDAKLTAAGAGGHGNYDAALTKHLTPLLLNSNVTKHLTREELAAVSKVVSADPSTRLGRRISAFPTWTSTIASTTGGGIGLGAGILGWPAALTIAALPPALSALGHSMRRGGSRALVKSAKEALGDIPRHAPPGINTGKRGDIYRILRMFGGT